MFGRLNTSVIRERRTLLENFLGTVVENIVIINSDTHLRSFLELDKTVSIFYHSFEIRINLFTSISLHQLLCKRKIGVHKI